MTAVADVAEAQRRTVAAGSARILLSTEHAWPMPPMPPRRKDAGVLERVMLLGFAGTKSLLRLADRKWDLRHSQGEGVLDLAGRRFMLDQGSFARLYADGQEWSGRSGRALSTLAPMTFPAPSPLWLVDLLAGVDDARDAGVEDVRGTSCRHLAATADLGKASEATPGGIAVRGGKTFDDLLALPVDVWIDESFVRRVRFASAAGTDTLELWDFGTAVDGLDWTRLPTFRSPSERAMYERRD